MAQKKKLAVPADYGALLVAVKERARVAQYQAIKAGNKNWWVCIGTSGG